MNITLHIKAKKYFENLSSKLFKYRTYSSRFKHALKYFVELCSKYNWTYLWFSGPGVL